MATLAFLKDTKCERYQPMFDPQRWVELIEQFKHDCYLLFNLTSTSLLSITLEAGLSTLKTPYHFSGKVLVACLTEFSMCNDPASKNPNCPCCNNSFYKVAQSLPCALHTHSRLVCRVTGMRSTSSLCLYY